MSETTKRTYPHGTAVEPLTLQDHKTIPAFEPNLRDHGARAPRGQRICSQRLGTAAPGPWRFRPAFHLTDEHYLPRILKDIQLEYINLGLVIEGSGPAVMEALLHHAHNEIIPASKLRGFINIDPVEIAARTGVWHEEKMYELGELTRLAPKGMKFRCQCQFLWRMRASAATQLGLAAAHLDYYLSTFGEVGLEQYWVALTAAPTCSKKSRSTAPYECCGSSC